MSPKVLVLLHTPNNIEITKYFNYKSKFDEVTSINNLPEKKDLDDKESKGTHWTSSFVVKNASVCFHFLRINPILR